MVCCLSIVDFLLGVHQDIQKEGEISKKDQAEQAHA